jgi:hypothetical protein
MRISLILLSILLIIGCTNKQNIIKSPLNKKHKLVAPPPAYGNKVVARDADHQAALS